MQQIRRESDNRKLLFRVFSYISAIYGSICGCIFLFTIAVLIFGRTSALGFNIGFLALLETWGGVVLLLTVLLDKKCSILNKSAFRAFLGILCGCPILILISITLPLNNVGLFFSGVIFFLAPMLSSALFILLTLEKNNSQQ